MSTSARFPATGIPAIRRLATLSRIPAFLVVTASLLLFMFAAAAPSPLYVVYQARWGFSSGVLTTVFAVYALVLLLALLVAGRLSDFLGRRPVIIGSLLLEAAAMLLFAEARSVAWLLAARAVQGLATGAATGALAAALVDLEHHRRPGLGALVNGAASTAGLAIGASGSGLLVQYGPAPRVTVFAVLLAGCVLGALALLFIPETAERRPGALASLVPRAAVPRQARAAFAAVVPGLVAVWALGGLYLSLVPSLVAGVLHVRNHLTGGLVISTMMLAAAVSSVALHGHGHRASRIIGGAAVTVGMVGTLAALSAHSVAVLFIATAVGGLGFGAAFLGALKAVVHRVHPTERAELFAGMYVVNYLAFSVPAVIAGEAVPHLGLLRTAEIYGCGVAVLAAASFAAALVDNVPVTGP